MATIDLACEMTPEAVWQTLRRDWLVSLGADSPVLSARSGNAKSGNAKSGNAKSGNAKSEKWFEQVAAYCSQLASYSSDSLSDATTPALKPGRPQVLIAEADPAQFLAGFWAALLAGWDIVLANPRWGESEWTTVRRLIQPTVVWAADLPLSVESFAVKSSEPSDRYAQRTILIPTGGSSGQVKFICHHWQSLTTAAVGFCNYFAANQSINAYCVLPLYHVSGLMQAFRTWVSGGQLFLVPSINHALSNERDLLSDTLRTESPTFISLVPTQLERLLRSGKADWLRQFKGVLLGGAPPWPDLLIRAAAASLPVCLSYGMTETAAMVTAIQANDFLSVYDDFANEDLSSEAPSNRDSSNASLLGSGRPLPHAKIRIEQEGQCLPAGEVGQVVVRSPAVAQGYHQSHYQHDASNASSAFAADTFYTDDLGYLDSSGNLHISGRISHKIISGGENIFPAEVEAALRSTQQVKDVYVLGLPDAEWGEVVTAIYVPIDPAVSPESLKLALVSASNGIPQLSHYKHPKRWMAIAALPRNAQGKLNRSALMGLVRSHFQ